jgi:hypothetical protein
MNGFPMSEKIIKKIVCLWQLWEKNIHIFLAFKTIAINSSEYFSIFLDMGNGRF